MRRSVMGRLGYVGMGTVLGVGMAVYGLGLRPQAALAGFPLVKCVTPATKPKPKPAVHHPASSGVVVDHTTWMAVSASHLHTDSGGDMPAPSGDAYLVVHVSLYNGGTSPQDYNPLDFHLHGQIDQVDYDADAIDIHVSPTLHDGSLAPGQFIAGDIVFQVPDNGQSYALTWTPQFDSTPLTVPIAR